MAINTSEATTTQSLNEPAPKLRVYRSVRDAKGSAASEHDSVVLVVHSDRVMRYRLTMCLERLGYEVIAVSTAERAKWALEHEPGRIDAVLASHHLHRSAGRELLHFVARQHPEVKRILMPEAGSNYPANDVDPAIDHVVFDARGDMTSVLSAMFGVK